MYDGEDAVPRGRAFARVDAAARDQDHGCAVLRRFRLLVSGLALHLRERGHQRRVRQAAVFPVGQERVVALERLHRALRFRAEFPVRPAFRQSVAQR